jgi:hypothetical protein
MSNQNSSSKRQQTIRFRYTDGSKKGQHVEFLVASTERRRNHYAKRGGHNLKRTRWEKLQLLKKEMEKKLHFGIEPNEEWLPPIGMPEITRTPIKNLNSLFSTL